MQVPPVCHSSVPSQPSPAVQRAGSKYLRGKPGHSCLVLEHSLLPAAVWQLVLSSGAVLQAWSNLVWWRVSLPTAGNWNERSPKVPPNPDCSTHKDSVILWILWFSACCSCAPTKHNLENTILRMEWSTRKVGQPRQHQTLYERLPKISSKRNWALASNRKRQATKTHPDTSLASSLPWFHNFIVFTWPWHQGSFWPEPVIQQYLFLHWLKYLCVFIYICIYIDIFFLLKTAMWILADKEGLGWHNTK